MESSIREVRVYYALYMFKVLKPSPDLVKSRLYAKNLIMTGVLLRRYVV